MTEPLRAGTASNGGGPASTTLRAADGTPIDARYDPPAHASDLAFVVAHGFTGGWRRPAVRRVASILAEAGGVVSFDFRGHGRSGGLSTVGDREVLDLDATVAWARELGHPRVAVVGFSMGASIVIRHAGLRGPGHQHVEAVAAVSGPSRWYYRGTLPMRRVHWIIERPLGRWVGRVALRTRISARGWDPVPEPPDALVSRIAPVPLLVVHGDADRYFPIEHAERLHAAAGEPKELWIEPGFGHAEDAASAALLARIRDWLAGRADGTAGGAAGG